MAGIQNKQGLFADIRPVHNAQKEPQMFHVSQPSGRAVFAISLSVQLQTIKSAHFAFSKYSHLVENSFLRKNMNQVIYYSKPKIKIFIMRLKTFLPSASHFDAT